MQVDPRPMSRWALFMLIGATAFVLVAGLMGWFPIVPPEIVGPAIRLRGTTL